MISETFCFNPVNYHQKEFIKNLNYEIMEITIQYNIQKWKNNARLEVNSIFFSMITVDPSREKWTEGTVDNFNFLS